eukprot:357392-Chlamydomonas_euryale.AAC.59
MDVDAAVVNSLLQPLVGKRLDYTAMARDTAPGKACTCTLLVATATAVKLPPGPGSPSGVDVICIELIADRFLRRALILASGRLLELISCSLLEQDGQNPGFNFGTAGSKPPRNSAHDRAGQHARSLVALRTSTSRLAASCEFVRPQFNCPAASPCCGLVLRGGWVWQCE